MYSATLVCSDPACAEELAGETATLHELETLRLRLRLRSADRGLARVEPEPLRG